MRHTAFWHLSAACLGVALLGGCSSANSHAGASSIPGQGQMFASRYAAQAFASLGDIQTPALVGAAQGGTLKYFPIAPHGGSKPQKLATVGGLTAPGNMVGNGQVLAIINQGPPSVFVYDIAAKHKKVFSDPFGVPVDIAIDKKANLFVLNFYSRNSGNIAMYPANSSHPKELDCKYIGEGQYIAADNEGNLYINGYDRAFIGVVEIPNGPKGPEPQNCTKLALLPEPGFPAGIAVDPKTDDLIVIDDPGECAGAEDGRMTIYPKPYKKSTGHSVDLKGNCVAEMRLDATSSIVFASDTPDSGPAYIIQRSYPGGRNMGSYQNGGFFGITTLPNTLPN